MTDLLASVRDPGEARLALEEGCDIIDLKEPSAGALGAVPSVVMRRVVDLVAGRRPVSATIGDLADSTHIPDAVRKVAATGVDLVKIGLFPGMGEAGYVEALASLAGEGYRLVAVLFADHRTDLGLLPALAEAGLYGVMLDTCDKAAGTLLAHRNIGELGRFTGTAHRLGLYCGLAGSLRLEDIGDLLSLNPDYLGFRGALCEGGRITRLSRDALHRARRLIPEQNAKLSSGAGVTAHG
ncbi:MAG: hypothetical protein D6786_00340 [Gammaproteobacteria bacterium]|nr:MAG: hypothetical protein D6786_00340 [Gammaproteobacteria bacterium]